MTLLVLGSLNMDLVTTVSRLPQPGETLTGQTFTTVPGGKGANQAVAVARLEAPVRMVGRVGEDNFGATLVQSLQAVGVQTDGILVDGETCTGVAMIAVEATGENQIIVVPGANGQVGAADLARLATFLPQAHYLLLQLEIPVPIVLQAAQMARQVGVRVILDPAPTPATLPAELYGTVDILTPNQVEAQQLTGIPVADLATAEQAADILLGRGVPVAIIKLGSQGAFCKTAQETCFVPAFPVSVVDTVAAGDAFNGGLAVALDDGQALAAAITWASAVAALAVTRRGAQAAMPSRQDVQKFLQHHSTGE